MFTSTYPWGKYATHTSTADIVDFGDNADAVCSAVEMWGGDTKKIVPQLHEYNKSGQMISAKDLRHCLTLNWEENWPEVHHV